MVATTLLAILVITVVGYLGRDEQGVPRGEVGLVLGVPLEHAMQARNNVINLPVILQLMNRSDRDARLSVSTPCRVLRFIITTPSDSFIQASGNRLCAQVVANRDLPAGDVLEEIVNIPLAAERYAPGRYILTVRFWNYEAQRPFVLVR